MHSSNSNQPGRAGSISGEEAMAPPARVRDEEEMTSPPASVSSAGADSSAGVGVCAPASRPGARRKKPHKDEASNEIRRRAELRETGRGVQVQPFGVGRAFANSAEFDTAWKEYEHRTLTKFTKRGGDLVPAWNLARHRSYIRAGKPVISEEYLVFIHAKRQMRCKFGVLVNTRRTGEREVSSTKFIACDARLTVDAHRIGDQWYLVTRDELCHHNHSCDQAMLDSTGKSALLENPAVLAEVHRMQQAKAPTRNIIDSLATNFNIRVTAKQLANINRDRLGGHTAMDNFKLLLQRFASFPGSSCTLIDDQEGSIVGVVTQSASQPKLFEKFGDNLILDWTHNTNYLGFYLGSLMVTSVSGRGVSIFDFLCLEQTESIMKTVFSKFIELNPSSRDRVKSFVIDKDYKEWRVLNELFDRSEVLLCQFHVVKWFAYVVTMRKYNLSVAMREKVLLILYAMVYARKTYDFEMHRAELLELLQDVSPSFLAYMDERWYNCIKMWSDCLRARIFTALNTTSNRIESSWNQVKMFLGKKLRIDLCMEAIFAYQTAVLRREYRLLIKYQKRLILRSKADPFVQEALSEMAEYSANAMDQQWRAAKQHKPGTRDPYCISLDSSSQSKYTVWRASPESSKYEVDAKEWTCTCDFHVTSALPCRHALHVARHKLHLPAFPVNAIRSRWCVW